MSNETDFTIHVTDYSTPVERPAQILLGDTLYIRQDVARECQDCGQVLSFYNMTHIDGVGYLCQSCKDGKTGKFWIKQHD